eukprot:TRINITY_DN2868_c0_g1_i1.p1 TRINITY_DN2868_c0_g1~~TRINITY_DN2868_c0_g1_i1.p1  ORF type:complete len:269 (-),score=12.38 TRINITY_DN2868_c0_g1_i1:204-1010(-)
MPLVDTYFENLSPITKFVIVSDTDVLLNSNSGTAPPVTEDPLEFLETIYTSWTEGRDMPSLRDAVSFDVGKHFQWKNINLWIAKINGASPTSDVHRIPLHDFLGTFPLSCQSDLRTCIDQLEAAEVSRMWEVEPPAGVPTQTTFEELQSAYKSRYCRKFFDLSKMQHAVDFSAFPCKSKPQTTYQPTPPLWPQLLQAVKNSQSKTPPEHIITGIPHPREVLAQLNDTDDPISQSKLTTLIQKLHPGASSDCGKKFMYHLLDDGLMTYT